MRAHRGFAILITALTLLLGTVTLTTTASASAAGNCGWYFDHFPKQYSIGVNKHIGGWADGSCTWADNWLLDVTLRDASNTKVPGSWREVTGCNGAWYYYDPYSGDDCLSTDGYSYAEVDSATWSITAPGTYTTHYLMGLANDCCDDFYWDSLHRQTTVAKYASSVPLTTTRSGNKVLFEVTPKHYWPAAGRYVPSPNATVIIQKRNQFNRWVTLDTVTGPTSKTYTLYQKQTVRAYVPETRVAWASHSLARTV